eukprot:1098561_1
MLCQDVEFELNANWSTFVQLISELFWENTEILRSPRSKYVKLPDSAMHIVPLTKRLKFASVIYGLSTRSGIRTDCTSSYWKTKQTIENRESVAVILIHLLK